MVIFLITLSVFLLAVIIMSLGVIIDQKQLRGSCGGIALIGPDGENLTCDTCPNRKAEHCQRDVVT